MYTATERTDSDGPTDAELVGRWKAGDAAARDLLVRRHGEALHHFCLQLTRFPEDAEDLCQESLLRAVAQIDTLKSGSAFRAWLFRIARNLSIDSLRRQRRFRMYPLPEEEGAELRSADDAPPERLEAEEERQTVSRALAKLKERYRTALILREVEGLTNAEIARELSVSLSAAEVLLFRARKRLREEYTKTEGHLPALALLTNLRDLFSRALIPVTEGSSVLRAGLVSTLVVTSVAVGMSHGAPLRPTLPPQPAFRAQIMLGAPRLTHRASNHGRAPRLLAPGPSRRRASRSLAPTRRAHAPAHDPPHRTLHAPHRARIAATSVRPSSFATHVSSRHVSRVTQERMAHRDGRARGAAGGHPDHPTAALSASVAPVTSSAPAAAVAAATPDATVIAPTTPTASRSVSANTSSTTEKRGQVDVAALPGRRPEAVTEVTPSHRGKVTQPTRHPTPTAEPKRQPSPAADRHVPPVPPAASHAVGMNPHAEPSDPQPSPLPATPEPHAQSPDNPPGLSNGTLPSQASQTAASPPAARASWSAPPDPAATPAGAVGAPATQARPDQHSIPPSVPTAPAGPSPAAHPADPPQGGQGKGQSSHP